MEFVDVTYDGEIVYLTVIEKENEQISSVTIQIEPEKMIARFQNEIEAEKKQEEEAGDAV